MIRQVKQGAARAAHLVHFPECALSGYFSKDFSTFADLDWPALERGERLMAEAARAAHVWVVFGTYRRARNAKPYNCTRVLAPSGELVETYDKHFLFERNGEHVECNPGRALKTIVIRGVRCGLLICNDSNRESLYRRYRKLSVELLLHSYYNARSTKGKTAFDDVIASQLRMRAYDHGLWISASNSCARYSPLSACLAAPDGTIIGAQRHRPAIVVADVQTRRVGQQL